MQTLFGMGESFKIQKSCGDALVSATAPKEQ